ncbi:TetR/AcrR family transcriptional regulator [Kocuria palustris]|uniref:TetR/AcrR family transcriptional regulator n=1 Tax=Kocuria palustris TaxID=71999 RepID=UPI00119DAC32|nr:TetR/AcrR family transcriptional regulator [Kocuria palustris]
MSAARPRTTRLPRQQRRRQLLEVALTTFAEQGYHRASMDDIAEAAGVSKPVLYQHFPGKHELYLALVGDSLDALGADLIEALREARPREGITVNRARVEEMLRIYFDFVEFHPQTYRLVFESDLMADPEIHARFEGFHMGVAEAVGGVLGPNAGLSRGTAVMLSRALTDMVQTGAGFWASHPETVTREEAQRQLFRLAWGGIGVLDEDWR